VASIPANEQESHGTHIQTGMGVPGESIAEPAVHQSAVHTSASSPVLPPEVEEELRRRAQATTNATVQEPRWRLWAKRLGPLGAVLIFLLIKLKGFTVIGKFLLPVLQWLKVAKLTAVLGKVLTTGGTMLLSVVVYAQRFGWSFAAGFVLSIFVHELGHVYAAWRKGVPVSAPIFIPGLGALILQKRKAKSVWDDAVIGIGGPVAGTVAGIACYMLHTLTGSELMLALAYTTFLLNLFNLIPVFPLDGGWIAAAVSPRLWLVGIIGLGFLFFIGWVRNPFIFLLILLAVPHLWKGITRGDVSSEETASVNSAQRVKMGLAYVGLCAFLAWMMMVSHLIY
jgi:Zn-dependent protease